MPFTVHSLTDDDTDQCFPSVADSCSRLHSCFFIRSAWAEYLWDSAVCQCGSQHAQTGPSCGESHFPSLASYNLWTNLLPLSHVIPLPQFVPYAFVAYLAFVILIVPSRQEKEKIFSSLYVTVDLDYYIYSI